MGNAPTPNTLHGWLVTDPTEAAKPGDEKFANAKQFAVGFEGNHAVLEGPFYSVKVAKAHK
ncbi:hypothetical protein D3C80_2112920 [compost metagenome]